MPETRRQGRGWLNRLSARAPRGNHRREKSVGGGLVLGAAIGAGFGVVFGNIALGAAIGAGLGIVVGSIFDLSGKSLTR